VPDAATVWTWRPVPAYAAELCDVCA
jgi:hypothetical protein